MSSASSDLNRITPMMAQYIEIKAANPDSMLFYRMGDFYELFFEDAEIASRALGIVLTKRGKHQGDDIPMCGVPIDRADDYLQRLIALGHRVAVCEQMEDPAEAKKRGPKSVVRRDVVRLVTPGTITEDRLLEPGRANILLAIARVRLSNEDWTYGLAAVDISTSAFHLSEVSADSLGAEIARIEPREIIASESIASDKELRSMLDQAEVAFVTLPRETGDAQAERRLLDYFKLSTLDGLGALTRAEIAAASAVIGYIERTQIAARPMLAFPTRVNRSAIMEIDASTRANLEMTIKLSGKREGSLLDTIDLCVTPGGSRLLAEYLSGPLTDVAAIQQRLDCVSFFHGEPLLRADLRQRLKSMPDLLRALSRLALQRGGPRDLAAVRDGLRIADAVKILLQSAPSLPLLMAGAQADLAALGAELEAELDRALSEDLPLQRRDGGFVRAHYLVELDHARALRDESRRVIASLQAKYSELAQTRQLKIKHNHFLGYFLEVPQQQGERLVRPPLSEIFIHRQTMADAMRFSTPELGELESKIASAADQALSLELQIFDRLTDLCLKSGPSIKSMAGALALIDVTVSLAELANQRDWIRPQVDHTRAFHIEGGRHPVVEAALKQRGQSFVSNRCVLADDLGAAAQIALVTGPNMAGKSTYLRQNALIAILAQMGSYVPAKSAHIGIVDRLFSRVGAADDLARGRSTFMVEMVETAAILNQASDRSLVILDEIGRGTATFDGLSIAWSVLEYLHEHNRARALFATHFHELTLLTQKLTQLKNLTMRVTDWQGEVVFLHEVIEGAADRSYGIQVARLAGLPSSVIHRAKDILHELETADTSASVANVMAELPLFASLQKKAAPEPIKKDALREALKLLNPDEMSPKEALIALYELKRLIESTHH
jgi:DNA mismatch repair protein MutS